MKKQIILYAIFLLTLNLLGQEGYPEPVMQVDGLDYYAQGRVTYRPINSKVTKLGAWDHVEDFDRWIGLAKVQKIVPSDGDILIEEEEYYGRMKDTFHYLLDTFGNTYPIVFDVKNLSSHITALDLSYQALTAIPIEVFQHPQLEILYLNNNQLSGLPPEIKELKNLKWLFLQTNQLHNLPPEIGELTKLTNLYLAFTQLTYLPPEFGKLVNLAKLDLSGNQLKTIPKEIGHLHKLENLYLKYNQLEYLCPEMGNLKILVELYLKNNKLTTLPKEIENLQNLKRLDLAKNKITVTKQAQIKKQFPKCAVLIE